MRVYDTANITLSTLLLIGSGGALSLILNPAAVAMSSLSGNLPKVSTNHIAQSSKVDMTWHSFVAFIQANGDDFQVAMLPESFPNGFADGQAALTAMHTGYSSYVVAREGVQLPNLSTVSRQINQNMNFNALGRGTSFADIPALATFPMTQYDGSNVIEVVHWAARYDDAGVRGHARESRQQTLPDGRRAYYMAQAGYPNPRTGWCTFGDERAQYSEYLCVNIANSPQTAFSVLSLIVTNSSNPLY